MNVKQPEIVADCTYFFYKAEQLNPRRRKTHCATLNYLQTDGKRYRELHTMKYYEMDPIQQVTVRRVMQTVASGSFSPRKDPFFPLADFYDLKHALGCKHLKTVSNQV